MTRQERLAVGLLSGSLLLGVLGDFLFDGHPLGLNALLWAFAFVAVLAAQLRLGRVRLHQGRRWMAAPLLVFAAFLIWHDSPLLVAVNLLAVAGAVALGALRRTRRRPARAGVFDYASGLASAGFASVAGAIHLLQREVPWDEAGRSLRGTRAGAVGRGVAIGLPLVALFGGLFVAADAVFENLVVSALPTTVGWPWVRHTAILGAVAWASAGLLRDLVAEREAERVAGPATTALRRLRRRLGVTEAVVVLAALDVLFLAFVLVQVRYLFGGSALVEARAGLTYAEYARHGFFELVGVAVLVLPLLLVVNAIVRGTPRQVRVTRALSAALVVLVFAVMASALERMWLYQREYGLTELRIYATGVILWLAVVFVWLGATVLRGRPRAFAVGALIAGFVASAAINVVDPDALIARTNVARPHLDAAYVGSLSDDAVPAIVARLPELSPPVRGMIARMLLHRQEAGGGLLGWNASRAHARAVLAEHRAELERYGRDD